MHNGDIQTVDGPDFTKAPKPHTVRAIFGTMFEFVPANILASVVAKYFVEAATSTDGIILNALKVALPAGAVFALVGTALKLSIQYENEKANNPDLTVKEFLWDHKAEIAATMGGVFVSGGVGFAAFIATSGLTSHLNEYLSALIATSVGNTTIAGFNEAFLRVYGCILGEAGKTCGIPRTKFISDIPFLLGSLSLTGIGVNGLVSAGDISKATAGWLEPVAKTVIGGLAGAAGGAARYAGSFFCTSKPSEENQPLLAPNARRLSDAENPSTVQEQAAEPAPAAGGWSSYLPSWCGRS